MNSTIWKYQLPACPTQTSVEMPWGAQVLSVAGQGDCVCLWAHVNLDVPKSTRTFAVYGTGQALPRNVSLLLPGSGRPGPAPGSLAYIGTAQTHEGHYVWHVFEIID